MIYEDIKTLANEFIAIHQELKEKGGDPADIWTLGLRLANELKDIEDLRPYCQSAFNSIYRAGQFAEGETDIPDYNSEDFQLDLDSALEQMELAIMIMDGK